MTSSSGSEGPDLATTTGTPAPGTGSTSSTDPSGMGSTEGEEGSTSGEPPGPDIDPETVLFEEDFESAAVDSVPRGWDGFVGYVVNMNNDPGGDVFALVDATRAHGGTQALHVRGGQSPAMLTRPLPPDLDAVHVRTYVWLSAKIGQNPGNNHETLLGVRGSVGQANEEVRFGEIKGVIGTNEVPSDDISPTMESWGRGPVVEAERWNCLEVAFVREPGGDVVRAWNDGTLIHEVTMPEQWNNGALGTEFLEGKFNEFILGWHSFSNFANEVWFDDLIVATERIPCPS